ELKYEQVIQLEGFKELSTQNLLDGIEKSKSIPFENVLFGLGIRFVGKTVAEKLAEHFENIENLKNATYDELVAVREIGGRIAESIVSFFQSEENCREIARLQQAGLNFAIAKDADAVKSDKLDNKTFVISGVFQKFGREEVKEMIKANGGKVLSSVSGNLDYLVAGENMGPAKLEKAQKLNVKIISEDEFLKMLE